MVSEKEEQPLISETGKLPSTGMGSIPIAEAASGLGAVISEEGEQIISEGQTGLFAFGGMQAMPTEGTQTSGEMRTGEMADRPVSSSGTQASGEMRTGEMADRPVSSSEIESGKGQTISVGEGEGEGEEEQQER